MKVVVIKYNAGNVFSVTSALKRLGVDPVITADPDRISTADRVIFPGVGRAGSAMGYLHDKGLDNLIQGLSQPFLGICLGLQLLCNHSEEDNTTCLGVFDQDVKRFPPQNKVPHMGWNSVTPTIDSPLFAGIHWPAYMYFVHSFYVPVGPWTSAVADYILPFSAALQKENFFALQFHPEKSGEFGSRVLRNFLEFQ